MTVLPSDGEKYSTLTSYILLRDIVVYLSGKDRFSWYVLYSSFTKTTKMLSASRWQRFISKRLFAMATA